MTNYVHYSKELEAAILGACMLEQTAFGRTYGIINEETFYFDDNKAVYKSIRGMYDNSIPIDIITVHHHMVGVKVNAVNISWYLVELTRWVTGTTHLEYHCHVLKELWRRREVLNLTKSGVDHYEETTDQIKAIQDKIFNLQTGEFKKEWYSMDELMFNLIQHQQDIVNGVKKFITTGFKSIDKLNGGFTAGQLIVIGARPSVGKSALMGKIAIAQAIQGNKIGIISLEMNNNEIAARLSSLETDIDFSTIYRNLFYDQQQAERFYNITNDRLSTLPIFVSDKTKVDINEIKAKASKLKNKHGLDCLMVDYLQLVDSTGNKNYNREQEVAKISRGLKLLAHEFEIPVIVLCQLNRQSTQRKGTARYPQLSDLRESGAIEQDADIVMMLHRDWLIEGFQTDQDNNSTEFKADLLGQKWRNGATFHQYLDFDPPKMKFKEQQVFTHVPRESNNDPNPF